MAVVNKELFFFDQPRRRCTKRERKVVDQLPFSLHFTGVSGTLKVEAYLRQQIKISEHSEQSKLEGFGDQSPAAGSNGEDVGKSKIVSPSSLQTKTLDQEMVRKVEYARKDKPFPGSDVRDGDGDEDEDTQRFLFEENKFAAPNLLAQLGRLLEWLYEKHQEKMNAPPRSRNYGNWPNWANLTSNNLKNSIINSDASYFDLRALDIAVPFHLQEKLRWDFDQLIVNTVYSKRQWQTTSYKHQAAAAKRDLLIPEESLAQDSLVNTSKTNLSKQDSLLGVKKLRSKSQDEQIKPHSSSETSPNPGKRDSISSIVMMESNSEMPTSVLGFRRESLKSSVAYNVPRTRLEKYKYLPDKSILASTGRGKKLGLLQAKLELEQEKDDVSAQMQQPQTSSIAFSLMSKKCEDQGWVNHEGQDEDLERLTVIEWAHSKLKEAISSRTACVLQAKERGEDGALVVKQYGESRGDLLTGMQQKKDDDGFLTLSDVKRDTASPAKKSTNAPVIFKQYGDRSSSPAKTKRGKSKIRRTHSGTAKVELFLIILPDNTMTLYYPSGKMAVCVAKNMVGEGKYTYVYKDDSDGTLMAYFTPTNAFCSDKHGKQFFCTTKEGTIYDKEGSVVRKWTWKASKLVPAVLSELNEYFTLRIVSRNIMTLYYNAEQESYKIMVGISQDEHSVHLNASGEMMTTGEYLSDAAQQSVKPKPRNKREERRARMNQQKQSQQANSEEIHEQRREDLDKKFPERKNLALDLPSDIELYKLKRRIKNVAFDWMESYRLLVGISSPVKVSVKHARRKQASSAKSLPGALPSSQDALRKLDHVLSSIAQRAPSAPPIPRGEKFDDSKVMSLDRLMCSLDGVKEHGFDRSHEEAVSPIYLTEVGKHRFTSGPSSPRPPFRCGMAKHEPRCSPKEGCPVALRAEILGDKYPFCRCRKREIPFISDVAYDRFIREYVPNTQLLVVSIVSSRRPDANPCTSMLEQLHYEKNRNRSFPCAQARHDPFRIVLYDVECSLSMDQPLLVKRQNVVPGMFLMYIGGKLLFADHIFNGYGNARKDFLKQITKSRKDFLQGLFLPADFRLSPTPCRSGLRAAWGGEIGGLSKIVCRTESNMTRTFSSPGSRLPSAVTSDSSESIILRTSGAKSAASFINLYQSIDSPFTRRIKTKPTTPHTLVRKAAPQSRA